MENMQHIEDFMAEVMQHGGEGAIIQQLSGRYEPGKSRSIHKLKVRKQNMIFKLILF